MRLILIILLILLSSMRAQARALIIDEVGEAQMIGKFIEYCQCPDDISVQDLASGLMDSSFIPYHEDRLNLASTKKPPHWIRLSIVNPFPEQRVRTLLIAHNVGDFWELYHQQGSTFQTMTTGLQHGGSGFYPHFTLNLHPGLNQVFLKFTTSKVVFWFGAEEKVANITQEQLHYASTMMAIALLITLASLATAILLRNTLFYYYAFYTFSSFIFMLITSNILIIYGINIFAITGTGIASLINLCMAYELVATLLFISYFLRLRTWSPLLSRLLTIFAVLVFSSLIIQSVLRYHSYLVQTVTILVYCFLITGIFFYAVGKGFGHARKALLSWSIYIVGVSISSLLMLGSHPLAGLNLAWATMNLEMLLFGFISLHELYSRQLKLTEDTKHSYEQLQKLVYPEQIALMKQGKFLEQTMPIKQAEAVILCFDVINSTKIDPHIHHAFFEDFFVQCQLIMSEGINVDGENVRLFRVKEMGDGFICSIGFPFPCGANREKAAVMFVDQVADIFQQNVKRHLGGKPCAFGVGIAGGRVGGFFPRSGIRQYDLYGMVVVLATRYENMRRQFQSQMPEGMSIALLQDSVFQKLPEDFKHRFQCCDLNEVSFKVRDDPDARKLWYQFIPTQIQGESSKPSIRKIS